MDTERIISDLKGQRGRLDRAIAALEGLSTSGQTRTIRHEVRGARPAGRKSRLSPAGRKRLSNLMKQRWAERRRKKAA